MNDIDRILSSEPVIETSAGFAARVMGQIHREAGVPPPIEFPWRRFLPGVVTCAALILVAVGLMIGNFDPATMPVEPAAPPAPVFEIARLADPPVIAAIALTGSLLVAWLVTRLAAPPQRELF